VRPGSRINIVAPEHAGHKSSLVAIILLPKEEDYTFRPWTDWRADAGLATPAGALRLLL
jgi:hypothetical protein